MLKQTLTALLLATAALPAAAEELHYNVVEFSESAGMEVTRDTMTARFRVFVEGKDRAAVNSAFVEKFNSFNRKSKNSAFQTELLTRSAAPRYQYNNGKRTQTGWEESAEFKVESRDFAALNRLIAETQNEASLEYTDFKVSKQKREQVIDQISRDALMRFKERAQTLAQTLGFSNYKIVKLNLGHVGSHTVSNGDMMLQSKMVRFAAAPLAAGAGSVVENASPGSEEISITVNGSVQM